MTEGYLSLFDDNPVMYLLGISLFHDSPVFPVIVYLQPCIACHYFITEL